MKTATRITRVVIRQHERELVGTVDLELLGSRFSATEPVCPGHVVIRHPRGTAYDPDFLQVGPVIVDGPGRGRGGVALPDHDALSDVVRSWLGRSLAQSIFGSTSGVYQMSDCSFERPVVYVLPVERPSVVAGF